MTATPIDSTAALFIVDLDALFITQAEAKKSVIYERVVLWTAVNPLIGKREIVDPENP
jgi:hypothetical protein